MAEQVSLDQLLKGYAIAQVVTHRVYVDLVDEETLDEPVDEDEDAVPNAGGISCLADGAIAVVSITEVQSAHATCAIVMSARLDPVDEPLALKAKKEVLEEYGERIVDSELRPRIEAIADLAHEFVGPVRRLPDRDGKIPVISDDR